MSTTFQLISILNESEWKWWWLGGGLNVACICVYKCLFRPLAVCIMWSAPNHCGRKRDEMFPWLEVATPPTKAGWNLSDFVCLWGERLLFPVEPLDWCHPLGGLFQMPDGLDHILPLLLSCHSNAVFVCVYQGQGHRTSTLSGSHFPPCLSHCIVFYEHSLILSDANFERTQTPPSVGRSRYTVNIAHCLKSPKMLSLASFL